MEHFKELYVCPKGHAINGEKRKYFVCPDCGRALCEEKDLIQFNANYCGYCGKELASAMKEALASLNDSVVTLGPGNYVPMQQ